MEALRSNWLRSGAPDRVRAASCLELLTERRDPFVCSERRRHLTSPEPAIRAPRSGKKSLEIDRADARTRTADPFITSEVLYQLSYVGEAVRV